MHRFLILFLCITATVGAQELPNTSIKNEIEAVNNLIQSTEAKLTVQRRLRSLLEKYRDAQDLLVLEENRKAIVRQTRRLVALANEIRNVIEEEALADYFDRPFLQDLAIIASVGNRRRLGKP